MRILHTSDWHLGRTLHGVDLLEYQASALDVIIEVAREREVDAVLVAGDVYDRAIPPVEAVRLLSETLRRLSEFTSVVVTPGNHDSALRLGFGADLMRDNIHLRARIEDIANPVIISGADGASARIYALPYLDPDVARLPLARLSARASGVGEDNAPLVARSHEAVIGQAMDLIRADGERRSADGEGPAATVVIAHAFVLGGQASDSERDIRVGGVDSVPSGVLHGIHYGALGHLHGPQEVRVPGDGDVPEVRYSGSPLAFSFSERHQKKAVWIVDLDAFGVREIERVPMPVPRALTELRGTLEELLGEVSEGHTQDWVKAVVTDSERPLDLVAQLRARFPHLLVALHEPAERGTEAAVRAVTAAQQPIEVLHDFVAYIRGGRGPDDNERAVLQEAVDAVNAAGRSD